MCPEEQAPYGRDTACSHGPAPSRAIATDDDLEKAYGVVDAYAKELGEIGDRASGEVRYPGTLERLIATAIAEERARVKADE